MAGPRLDSEEPAQLNVPFPDALGLASLNGVRLLRSYPNPSKVWAQPQGKAALCLRWCQQAPSGEVGPDPHQGGRAGPSGPEIMLCSRRHRSPKDITRRVPGIFSGRGSEGTAGSSICSCGRQRVQAMRHSRLIPVLERTASRPLGCSQQEFQRHMTPQHTPWLLAFLSLRSVATKGDCSQ